MFCLGVEIKYAHDVELKLFCLCQSKLPLPFFVIFEQDLSRVVHLVVLTLALFLMDTASIRDIIKHRTCSSQITIAF